MAEELRLYPQDDWQVIEISDGDHSERFGFLQLCIDRRFHRAIQQQFETLGRLGETQYWLHTGAGGTPKMRNSHVEPDYAYAHNARFMGWSAHGKKCGGFSPPLHPHEASDQEIRNALWETALEKAQRYPDAQHYAFFATEENGQTVIWFRGPVPQPV